MDIFLLSAKTIIESAIAGSGEHTLVDFWLLYLAWEALGAEFLV